MMTRRTVIPRAASRASKQPFCVSRPHFASATGRYTLAPCYLLLQWSLVQSRGTSGSVLVEIQRRRPAPMLFAPLSLCRSGPLSCMCIPLHVCRGPATWLSSLGRWKRQESLQRRPSPPCLRQHFSWGVGRWRLRTPLLCGLSPFSSYCVPPCTCCRGGHRTPGSGRPRAPAAPPPHRDYTHARRATYCLRPALCAPRGVGQCRPALVVVPVTRWPCVQCP